MPEMPHVPVLYEETLLALQPHSAGRYIDGTVGAGGHALGILEKSSPGGQLLGLDLDPEALDLTNQRLSGYESRFTLAHASYTTLKHEAARLGWEQVDGILVDLGVSSMQLDRPERGFSFQQEGPLDMRFSPNQSISAADLVNSYPERDLADIIWRYGEEKRSRRIARAIVENRPYRTTLDLARVIETNIGRSGRIHPATLTFQALRIAVNDELRSIEDLLPQAIDLLAPGGRFAVISFHSLEDRLVKHFFRRESRDCVCPPEQPICTCGHRASITEIHRRPVEAQEEEVKQNPRARSARLRVVEKLALA